MGFVATAATILSGAVAERIKFKAYVEYTIIMCALTYPIIVHCVWSTNGVFSKDRDSALFGCGVLDFAGSGVVHVTGGLASLIAVYLMGPRDCVSYDEKGVKTAPLGQSEVFKTLGTLCLWFGWFGFNGASTIYLVGYANIAARALVMTTVSGGTAGLISGAIWIYFSGDNQINITPALNGILTGLVGITANCATVELEGAFLIGIGSGIAYSFMVYIMDKYQIDDVVQAAQVHMGGGIWGLVAGGFFTSPKLYKEAYNDVNDPQKCAGVLYGGSGAQLGANLVFLAMCSLWIICSLGTFFYYQHVNNLLRVTLFTEKVGVDRVLHNANMAIDEAALESTIGHLNDTDSLVMKQS